MTDTELAAFDARFRDHIAEDVIGDSPPPLDAAAVEVIRRTVAAAPGEALTAAAAGEPETGAPADTAAA